MYILKNDQKAIILQSQWKPSSNWLPVIVTILKFQNALPTIQQLLNFIQKQKITTISKIWPKNTMHLCENPIYRYMYMVRNHGYSNGYWQPWVFQKNSSHRTNCRKKLEKVISANRPIIFGKIKQKGGDIPPILIGLIKKKTEVISCHHLFFIDFSNFFAIFAANSGTL